MATYSELFLRFPGFKTRAVTLSFDDGHPEDRHMIEMMQPYGMKCTFNLNSHIACSDPARMSLDDCRDLYRDHEIACHSLTHPHLNNLDLGGIAYQITHNRELLEDITHRPVEGFAYPYGLQEDVAGMVDCLRCCGLRYGRTTNATYRFDFPRDFMRWHPTCHHQDPRFDEMVRLFFQPDDIAHPWRIRSQLFYIWGHSYEFKNNWEAMEKLCQAVGGKDEVWYATNGQVVDYYLAYRALRRSVNGKFVYNPTDTDVYVSVNGKNVVLEKSSYTTVG